MKPDVKEAVIKGLVTIYDKITPTPTETGSAIMALVVRLVLVYLIASITLDMAAYALLAMTFFTLVITSINQHMTLSPQHFIKVIKASKESTGEEGTGRANRLRSDMLQIRMSNMNVVTSTLSGVIGTWFWMQQDMTTVAALWLSLYIAFVFKHIEGDIIMRKYRLQVNGV